MLFVRTFRPLAALTAALGFFVGSGFSQNQAATVDGLKVETNYATKETTVTGNARLTYGTVQLTADTIRYNDLTHLAIATGHFNLTYAARRLVADEGTYNLATQEIHVRNLRLGEFPVYLFGDTVDGTIDELTFTNATIFFRENASYTPA